METEQTRALREAIGCDVIDRNGEKVGKVSEVYVDDATHEPEWLAVTSGMFGRKTSFVPIVAASFVGTDVEVLLDKAEIEDAPSIDPEGSLSEEEEARLYAHYGRDYSKERSATGLAGDAHPSSGSDDAMTRSEEELRVGKTSREAGRARLHKWIETENATFTVPVKREKARVVTEPITDENRDAAMRGRDLSEGEHEIVLSQEEVEVEKNVVPQERVRLEAETDTDEERVSEDVRKERIDFEGDEDPRSRS